MSKPDPRGTDNGGAWKRRDWVVDPWYKSKELPDVPVRLVVSTPAGPENKFKDLIKQSDDNETDDPRNVDWTKLPLYQPKPEEWKLWFHNEPGEPPFKLYDFQKKIVEDLLDGPQKMPKMQEDDSDQS